MAKRPTHRMPNEIAAALRDGGVRKAYDARPHYQRNDYVGWIVGSKSDATRERRIGKMVAELRKGGVYMGMKHGPSAKV